LIAADTSSLRRYLDGTRAFDVSRISTAIREDDLIVPPVVIAELISDPRLSIHHADAISQLRILELRRGYWWRSGELRANTLRVGHKAKLADVLIAQSCIDHDVPLITYDGDFRHFTRAGLKLA
jgi:predicted nucleic acid-binding protein